MHLQKQSIHLSISPMNTLNHSFIILHPLTITHQTALTISSSVRFKRRLQVTLGARDSNRRDRYLLKPPNRQDNRHTRRIVALGE